MFIAGLVLWVAIGAVGGAVAWMLYRGAGTGIVLTLVFGGFGALIGGMLGISGYIYHDPNPFRFGGLLGAVLGALFFPFLYHFVAKKAL